MPIVRIPKRCILCDTSHIVAVDETGYMNWQNGELIQKALPTLSIDDRELLISGICGKCFDNIPEE